jgi:excisionase family DNA binding protein
MAVLMSSQEVCEYLGIKLNNLYQLRSRGSLNWTEKKGKAVFFDREKVEAYKAKRDKSRL